MIAVREAKAVNHPGGRASWDCLLACGCRQRTWKCRGGRSLYHKPKPIRLKCDRCEKRPAPPVTKPGEVNVEALRLTIRDVEKRQGEVERELWGLQACASVLRQIIAAAAPSPS